MPPGFPLVISAPSGAGKSTICRRLVSRDKELEYSVSTTTRPPRKGERDGRDYRFVDVEEFKRRIHRDEFLEWALVHDHYYGTPRAFVDNAIGRGRVAVMAIDVQGASAVRRKRPQAVTLFLLPPSFRSLETRLHGRRQDSDEAMRRRLANAPEEIRRARHYDYLVVNEDLPRAVHQIECILTAERLRTARQDLETLGIGR